MANITVPFSVLARGYSVTGDVRSGYKATVLYLLAWADAFHFVDQVFGAATASTVGPVTWTLPYRFPAANADLYASSFTLTPCGASGTPVPTLGLAPGEFFTHAIVQVQFDQPAAQQNPQGGNNIPNNMLQQLDPNNPITACEQSVKLSGRIEPRKAGTYLLASGLPVTGEIGMLIPECKLVLSFPRVPYLPWQLVQPFVGTLNNAAMLGCPKGTLLLEGMDTKVTPSPEGYNQSIQLEYSYRSLGDWNLCPSDNGTMVLVHQKGTSDTDANRIYSYLDHSLIFSSLEYQVAG